jgi:predicted ATPase
MKIDIHTHTRKCKSGDAPTREISAAEFSERVLSTDVGIIAITNHNLFDLDQFRLIEAGLGESAQAWPGIELDIVEAGVRGHLIVIVSPKRAYEFSSAVGELTTGFTPDSFSATVDQVLEKFEPLDPLYVAHYRQKKPNIAEDALERLIAKAAHPQRVIKEVTNSISAGIYISHGHASIYGSDVHDWAEYERLAQDLPDLRLPVDSFEHFCLLLEKDPTTINTALNRKTIEEVVLQPFEDESFLKLSVFNDINVVFGAKGTGKSCILRAIAKHFAAAGLNAKLYEPGSDRLAEIFDLKGKDLTINLDTYSINYCSDEIDQLRSARESNVTGMSKYVAHFASKTTNRNAKRILLKDIEPQEAAGARQTVLDYVDATERTASYLQGLRSDVITQEVLGAAKFSELTKLLTELLEGLRARTWEAFLEWKEVHLLNSAIEVFRREVERKTGNPAKPTTTGFLNYAANRNRIAVSAAAIVGSFDTDVPLQTLTIGPLGENKGVLELHTKFRFQDGTVTDGEFIPLTRTKKGTQKKFAAQVRTIRSHVYRDDLFQRIAQLNEIEDVEDIKTVYELVLFKRYFALNGRPYSPSSGEASMVMLQKELAKDADVYILDEPERSLGNEYISDVIVPLIKERARTGKRVFISTHDANIAVRTLPYSSVYRTHGPDGYRTYLGNPFSNRLVNSQDDGDNLDWRIVSMRTLEGGPAAFGERGRIYGQS